MLTAIVYPSRRLFKKHWRYKILAANGEPLGHQYNDPRDAEHALGLIFSDAPVELEVHDEAGTIVHRGRIR